MSASQTVLRPWNRYGPERMSGLLLASILGFAGFLYFWYGLPGKAVPLNDFGSFWASGKAVLNGGNPYGVHPNTFRVLDGNIIHPNLNPPASLLLFAPLSLVDPHVLARTIWWAGLLLYFVIVVSALRHQPNRDAVLPMAAWAFALPAFWDGLRLGQVYVPLLVLAAGALHLLKHRRDVSAGLLIGLFVAIKPNFLFWPLLLYVGGYRRVAIWSAASFVAVSLLPAFVFGPAIYGQWFDVVSMETGNRKGVFPNASVMAIGYRSGSAATVALLVAVVLTWTALQLRRHRLDITKISATGIALGVVLSPVVWFHYLIFLLPAMLASRWNAKLFVGAGMMLIPIMPLYLLYNAPITQDAVLAEPVRATVGSVFSWAALLLLSGLAARQKKCSSER